MNAEELCRCFDMQPHVENGSFLECNFPSTEEGRPSSGSIYFYVAPESRTEFHVLDCDEYWIHVQGSPLDIWMFDSDGALTVAHLGTSEGCVPLVHVPKGTVFGSRHANLSEAEGTFLACITVPRYENAGFRLLDRAEMLNAYPQVGPFWE